MRLFAIALFVALFPLVGFGQIIPELQTPIEIRTVPEAPAPGGTVLVQAVNVTNKDAVTYVWRVNGSVTEQGIGRDRITVTAGSLGQSTTVSVTVTYQGEVVGETSRTLLPAELDLVWEANTYVPPFYIGRPLPTGDSTITISATPNMIVGGGRVSANNLVYRWFINGSDRPYRTGYGLSSISLTPPLFDSAFSVTVEASTQNGNVSVRKSVGITPQNPEIALYEQHPLLGTLFHKAIFDTFQMTEEEVTLRLFPLFVLSPIQSVYTWNVNDSKVDPGEVFRELTLRRAGEGAGRAEVSVSLQTPESFYETAKGGVVLRF